MRVIKISAYVMAMMIVPSAMAVNWIEWTVGEGGNGRFYALTNTLGTWDDVQAEAQSRGTDLVTINTQEENDWIYQTFVVSGLTDGYRYPAWIGFYQDTADPAYSEPGGGWKWISGEPVTLVKWNGPQPDDYEGVEDWGRLLRQWCLERFQSSHRQLHSDAWAYGNTRAQYDLVSCSWRSGIAATETVRRLVIDPGREREAERCFA